MKTTVVVLTIALAVLFVGSVADAQTEPNPGPWGAKNEAAIMRIFERALAKPNAVLGGFGDARIQHNLARCALTILERDHPSIKKLEAQAKAKKSNVSYFVYAAATLCRDGIAPVGTGLTYFESHNGTDDGRIAAFYSSRNTSGCVNGRAANGSCNGQG